MLQSRQTQLGVTLDRVGTGRRKATFDVILKNS